MIRVATPTDHLEAHECYGLSVLLDLSRLLLVDDPDADVVRLLVTDEPEGDVDAYLRGRSPPAVADGHVRIPRQALALVATIAGAAAEQRSDAADRYGRVPAEANPLVRAGRWREPVVSQHALELRKAAIAAAGRRAVRLLAPWPEGRRWAAAFTHDLDVVTGWPIFTLARLAELVRTGHLRRAGRVLSAALGAIGGDPVARGVREVLRAEAAARARSTWYILCGTPSPATWVKRDVTYRADGPAARRLLGAIAAAGMEIGLHGSLATLRDPVAFGQERERLGEISGQALLGVRQHFLRMRPGTTQRAMAAAGFAYDATYGFADRNGFRLGVADIVPGWDAARDALSGLEEVPLVWMDRAQSKYQGIQDPAAWIAEARGLIERCREVEGLWVGLWHPNLTPALGFPDAPGAYRDLLDAAGTQRPYVGTLAALVEWRRVRRSARARSVSPDGRVELITARPTAQPLVIEDSTGRTITC